MTSAAPFYRYDPNLGNPRDRYMRADAVHPAAHRPELAGRLVAHVEGETIINTMWGRRRVRWQADPGTPCLILGYWADGTVHLRWPAINHHYSVDGRFPDWVAVRDPDAEMAGGGRILKANNPVERVRGMIRPEQAAVAVLTVIAVLIVIGLLARLLIDAQ